MPASSATKPAKAPITRKAKLESVPEAWGGSLRLPAKCKPSKVASTDQTRPLLTHAYLRKHNDVMWLMTTDSYSAVAIKAEGDAKEGWVPIGALRMIERGQEAEQLSATSWKITLPDGYQVFDCASGVTGSTQFPNLDALGLFEPAPKADGPAGGAVEFGLNPDILARLADGLGASGRYAGGLALHVHAPMKAVRAYALGHPATERVGLFMPIRLNV